MGGCCSSQPEQTDSKGDARRERDEHELELLEAAYYRCQLSNVKSCTNALHFILNNNIPRVQEALYDQQVEALAIVVAGLTTRKPPTKVEVSQIVDAGDKGERLVVFAASSASPEYSWPMDEGTAVAPIPDNTAKVTRREAKQSESQRRVDSAATSLCLAISAFDRGSNDSRLRLRSMAEDVSHVFHLGDRQITILQLGPKELPSDAQLNSRSFQLYRHWLVAFSDARPRQESAPYSIFGAEYVCPQQYVDRMKLAAGAINEEIGSISASTF